MTMEYRSIWTSDHHLGNQICDDQAFLKFMHDNDAPTFGLVGDFIDGWSLSRRWYWPQTHNDVVQKILRKARKGSLVLLIPGNHDDFLEFLLNLILGHVTIVHEYIYTAADGKRYLVMHGHQFDVHIPIWLMRLGSWAYDATVTLNLLVHKIRNKLHLPHWSLSAYLKKKVKSAVSYMENFETMAVEYARTKGCDGIICGHIHAPCIKTINGIVYINCGDWLEHCSALVENPDGKFELIYSPRTT
jgi:UDP-2,3-diacylglucosamine pyrophosphatase LpxH